MSISDNPYVLLILINIFLLILSCIMDVAPLIVITTPVLLPVIQQIGMHSIQFGIVMLCNLAIGMRTPPVGATLFAGCAVGKIPIGKCMKGILLFYLAMVVVLLPYGVSRAEVIHPFEQPLAQILRVLSCPFLRKQAGFFLIRALCL